MLYYRIIYLFTFVTMDKIFFYVACCFTNKCFITGYAV